MKIQESINSINYWDSPLLNLDINYFADEITIKCDEGDFHFIGCNNIHIENYHVSEDEDLSPRQWDEGITPYSIQDISVLELDKETKSKYQGKYEVKVLMDLMVINLTCNKVNVTKKP